MSDIESRKIRLGIIDLKLHNLFSIYQACENIGYRTTVIEDNLKHYNHDIIILPGVGSFKSAMKYLNKNGTKSKLLEFTLLKNKILVGICLGMQLLFEKSQESLNDYLKTFQNLEWRQKGLVCKGVTSV